MFRISHKGRGCPFCWVGVTRFPWGRGTTFYRDSEGGGSIFYTHIKKKQNKVKYLFNAINCCP